jgi:hypothetical protein
MDDASSEDWEYRFDCVKSAVDVLRRFTRQLRRFEPPDVPEGLPSTRGWTIRLEGLPQYCDLVPRDGLEFLAKRLDDPIKFLTAYVRRWGEHVSAIDPLLRDYEIMPRDENTIASVCVLLERALFAQRLAIRLLKSQ